MRRKVIAIAVVGAAALHLYSAGVSPFTALIQRPLHLALMAAAGFLGLGTRRGDERTTRQTAVDWLLTGGAVASCLYLVSLNPALVERAGRANGLDIVAGALMIVLTLELARRATSWGLVAVALAALAFSQLGPWLPGVLAHRGYAPRRVVEHLYLGTEGLWGVPLGVSADFVYLFILFGVLLDRSGGGDLLIGIARRAAGRTRGGPAKTAALASALMGSLSGSAVANVATTGSLTIPLMKRAGFRPSLAGAIEAAASTGGQIMPPVMGAGAFILATWTNIPYLEVALGALIPALLYYAALTMAIHFAAARDGIEPMSSSPDDRIVERLHLLVPLVAIVVLLALGRSPMRAAFWGVVTAALAAATRGATRLDRNAIWRVLRDATRGTVQVAAACAAAGIVVGVATLTGIGLRMSELIVTLSGGSLVVALVWTALGSMILGMGLPTTAAYVVLAALGAPALVQLGAPLLAAHLFIFYFGCMSNVTPPVSLAAYAAAGLAGASPLRTALTAAALAATGFLVPFAFVFGPELLLDAPVPRIAQGVVTALAGVVALAAAATGYHNRPLPRWERVMLLAAGGLLMAPGLVADAAGATLLTLSFLRPTEP